MKASHEPSLERFRIPSLDSRLEPEERAVRFALQDCIVSMGRSVSIEDLLASMREPMPRPEAMRHFNALIGKEIVATDDDGRVAFAYPVSSLPTLHEVALADGRRLFAMCAVDALGCAFHFRQDVSIRSKCHACGKPVRVRIEADALAEAEPRSAHVLHVDLQRRSQWAGSS